MLMKKLLFFSGLFQNLPPESREFEELVKLFSSFYLETNSRGSFTYAKARLIHSELLEKEVSLCSGTHTTNSHMVTVPVIHVMFHYIDTSQSICAVKGAVI